MKDYILIIETGKVTRAELTTPEEFFTALATTHKPMNHTTYPKGLKKRSAETLRYIMTDARQAIEANPENPNCGYYQDEILYCAQELKNREVSC